MFETAALNEPSVFELQKFYCTLQASFYMVHKCACNGGVMLDLFWLLLGDTCIQES